MRFIKKSFGIVAALAVAILIGALDAGAQAGDGGNREHIVEIRNFQFTPRMLNVVPGDTIVWINYDIVPHTATADDGSWDSGELKNGERWSMTVERDAFGDYFCAYHPSMKAGLSLAE